jgi:hypothetical protein
MFPSAMLANSLGVDVKEFWTGTAGWYTWTKPLGKTMAHIVCFGSGAGGGGGGATNTTGGGSGGGASNSTLSIPLNLLPDVLYVQPGLGGAAGASATGGSAGNISYVSVYPATTVQ